MENIVTWLHTLDQIKYPNLLRRSNRVQCIKTFLCFYSFTFYSGCRSRHLCGCTTGTFWPFTEPGRYQVKLCFVLIWGNDINLNYWILQSSIIIIIIILGLLYKGCVPDWMPVKSSWHNAMQSCQLLMQPNKENIQSHERFVTYDYDCRYVAVEF